MADTLRGADDTDDPPGVATPLTVELWTRRPVCGPRTETIDRLTGFRAEGALADVSVETWPEAVSLSDRDGDSDLLARINRFEELAAERGLTLRPPFERRSVSLLVGERRSVLRTPMLFAAVSDDDGLVAVYPCTREERTWTVGELLDALDPDAEGPAAGPTDLPGPWSGG
jgi:hypothetical protein